jgi:hypothetical protein
LFPEPFNSSGAQAQAQAQGAFCPFVSEASSLGGTQAQAEVSFTQMLTVICSYSYFTDVEIIFHF